MTALKHQITKSHLWDTLGNPVTPLLPTKLPMYDAGSTGFRRTMPSSPGDALPITANLQTLDVKVGAEQNTYI